MGKAPKMRQYSILWRCKEFHRTGAWDRHRGIAGDKAINEKKGTKCKL